MPLPKLHPWYPIFLKYIEPVSALVGAYFATFSQMEYLTLTHAPSAPDLAIPLSTHVVLNQLGNLYLYFFLVEALVFRATSEISVWRALCTAMLIADFGHLWSVKALGWEVYYDIPNYNAMDYGNVVFVYLGAATRIALLMGLGVGKETSGKGRKKTR